VLFTEISEQTDCLHGFKAIVAATVAPPKERSIADRRKLTRAASNSDLSANLGHEPGDLNVSFANWRLQLRLAW